MKLELMILCVSGTESPRSPVQAVQERLHGQEWSICERQEKDMLCGSSPSQCHQGRFGTALFTSRRGERVLHTHNETHLLQVVHVVRRPNDGSDTAWAFVQFRTRAERDHAIHILDRTAFGEQTLVVKPAKDELDFDPNEPVSECWFCLGTVLSSKCFTCIVRAGSPSSDKALIVSVGNESYLAVDKGPISDDHVLIIPTNHYPNTLRMSERCCLPFCVPGMYLCPQLLQ